MKNALLIAMIMTSGTSFGKVQVLKSGQITPDGNYICGAPSQARACTLKNTIMSGGGVPGRTEVYIDGLLLKIFDEGSWISENSQLKAEMYIAHFVASGKCYFDKARSQVRVP